MILVLINEDGRAIGFYHDEINKGNIPEGAFEIDHDTWQKWISHGNHVKWDKETKSLVEAD